MRYLCLLCCAVWQLGSGCADTKTTSPGQSPQSNTQKKTASATQAPVASPGQIKKIGAPLIQAKVVKTGKVACFEQGAFRADKPGAKKEQRLAYCEVSAVASIGNRLLMASDKEIPGAQRSSIFTVSHAVQAGASSTEHNVGNTVKEYLPASVFRHLKKAEDFAVTLDGKTVLLTSGFDRIKTDSKSWHVYNTVMAFPADAPEKGYVVNPSSAGEYGECSLELRRAIALALADKTFPDGMPYFKVESLAVIPGQKVLFGVREMGASYKTFSYTVTILVAPFSFKDDRITIDATQFELFYQMPVPTVRGHKAALSSLAFDAKRNGLYMLTSYEEEVKNIELGGFLFFLDLSNISKAGPEPTNPQLVYQSPDELLHFGHKPEGVSLLDADTLIVVHDDDRVLKQVDVQFPNRNFEKQPEEAAYTILRLSNGVPKDAY